MEDRLTPVLYLEMTESEPDEYARSRVGDVLALPGVERARATRCTTARMCRNLMRIGQVIDRVVTAARAT